MNSRPLNCWGQRQLSLSLRLTAVSHGTSRKRPVATQPRSVALVVVAVELRSSVLREAAGKLQGSCRARLSALVRTVLALLRMVATSAPLTCTCFSVCSIESTLAFVKLLWTAEFVRSNESAWFPYLRAVYGKALKIPFDLRNLRFVYQADSRWRALHTGVDWPLAACFGVDSKNGQRSGSQDEGRPPPCKDCCRFGVGCGAPATSVAVPNAGDTGREFYYSQRTGGVSRGMRWYFRQDSMANAMPSYGWAEVIRWRKPGEGSNGTGVWFAPAAGSNIFINLGNTLWVASIRGALEPLMSRWSTQRNFSVTPKDARSVGELVGADLRGDLSAAYLAYLGYELRFDSLQFAEGSGLRSLGSSRYSRFRLIYQPEICMTSSQSFVKPHCCDGCNATIKARECPRGLTTCGLGIELRKLSGAPCICSEQIDILNCDGEGPTNGTVHSSPDLSSSECPHSCSEHGVCEHGVCK